jgi:hypothetical protein
MYVDWMQVTCVYMIHGASAACRFSRCPIERAGIVGIDGLEQWMTARVSISGYEPNGRNVAVARKWCELGRVLNAVCMTVVDTEDLYAMQIKLIWVGFLVLSFPLLELLDPACSAILGHHADCGQPINDFWLAAAQDLPESHLFAHLD